MNPKRVRSAHQLAGFQGGPCPSVAILRRNSDMSQFSCPIHLPTSVDKRRRRGQHSVCAALHSFLEPCRRLRGKVNRKGKPAVPLPRAGRQAVPIRRLWETWGDTAASLLTCCLITTDANGTVSRVHDCMPVILPAKAVDAWLDLATPADRLQ